MNNLVKGFIDPLQFAYRKNRKTDDAVLHLLENVCLHLENNYNIGSS